MLVNALSVVKSCYFYLKFARFKEPNLLNNQKTGEKKKFYEKSGAALVRTITSDSVYARK